MANSLFNILVLDGGGSKGIYTLGVLTELELKLGVPLYQHFDLIYGTSTGSIIGSLLALGFEVAKIKKLYIENIPEIMNVRGRKGKSKKLQELGEKVFGKKEFTDFKTDIGIVALNYDTQNPLVFKSNLNQAHGMKHSFIPGFGCTISDAVQSSCSAYPIFEKKQLQTVNQGKIKAVDGGYIANNSTLFALIDSNKAFKIDNKNIRLLSVGTGNFIEKSMGGFLSILNIFKFYQFIQRIITSNTNTNVILAKLLYNDIKMVRVNNTYNEPEYGTNMIERDMEKLEMLFKLGRNSFAQAESEIDDLLQHN